MSPVAVRSSMIVGLGEPEFCHPASSHSHRAAGWTASRPGAGRRCGAHNRARTRSWTPNLATPCQYVSRRASFEPSLAGFGWVTDGSCPMRGPPAAVDSPQAQARRRCRVHRRNRVSGPWVEASPLRARNPCGGRTARLSMTARPSRRDDVPAGMTGGESLGAASPHRSPHRVRPPR